MAEDVRAHEDQLNECLRHGNDILRRAHPDAIPTMKHWINILKVTSINNSLIMYFIISLQYGDSQQAVVYGHVCLCVFWL